jgi:RHS repeat-associated protein
MTDTSGTRHSFGGRNKMVDETSVVRDTAGNIVHWALLETRNVYNDFVQYSYRQSGGTLYPDRITYTGSGTTEGLHRVEFLPCTDDEVTRKDLTTSARLGFLQTNNQQLNEIRVYFGDELVRSFRLNYEEGVFAKTMLKSITQNDSQGNPFDVHEFDYYNDVETGLYGKAQEWNTGNDVGLEKLFKDKVGFLSSMSAINGAYTSGNTTGGGVMVGVGWGSAKFTVSAGVTLIYTKNKSKGIVALADINGDGLPDKVFVDDNSLWFRPNNSIKGIKGEEFGGKIRLIGMNKFSYSESSSLSRNINASVGVNIGKTQKTSLGAGISRDKATTTDKMKIYISDFNGDGLPDIASNGMVYFNYIGIDGLPHFAPSSQPTPNPINGTDPSLIDADFKPNYEIERKIKEAEYPLHDVVRLWRAPYDGELVINGGIELIATTEVLQSYDGEPDGVIASIQKEDELLWKDSLATGGILLNPELGTITVKAGDRLLFRLQSRYSGALDEVKWSPCIAYDSIYSPVDTLDENGINRYEYSAKNDFVFSGQPSVMLAKPGSVEVSMTIQKKQLKDSITLVVDRYNTINETSLEVYRETFAANDEINTSTTLSPIFINENDTVELFFHVESNTPVDWTGIVWKPVVRYDSDEKKFHVAPYIDNMFNRPNSFSSKHKINTQTFVDEDKSIIDKDLSGEKPSFSEVPGPEYFVKSDTISSTYEKRILAIPFLDIKSFEYPDTTETTVKLVLRDSVSIIKTYNAQINGLIWSGDTLEIDSIYEGKNLQATYYVGLELKELNDAGLRLTREKVFEIFDTYKDPKNLAKTIIIGRVDTVLVDCDTLLASVYSKFNRTETGHLYRGWGQFGWDGNAQGIIPKEKLRYDDRAYKEIDENTIADTTLLADKVENEPLFTMSFNAERNRYQSISEYTFVGATSQSSSRLGSLEIVLDSINFPAPGTGLAAPVQKTESITYTTSTTGSIAGYSGGYSKSTTTSWSTVSAIDLNGDRYPDWIRETDKNVKSQYTTATGGLSNLTRLHSTNIPQTKGEANSISVGRSKSVAQINRSSGTAGNSEKAESGTLEATFNASLSGNYSRNKDFTANEWIDMNGDGLPDMVYKNGKVQFNTGYGFSDMVEFGHSAIRKNTSNTFGGGGAISIPITGFIEISNGINFSYNITDNDFQLADINGDGLPDMVKDGLVAFNTGSGYEDFVSWNGGIMTRNKSTSTSMHGSIAYPIPITLPYNFKLIITPSVTLAHSEGVSRTLSQIMDINGDGFPDIVESDANHVMTVRLNKMGRTNLLKTVHRPYGATITLDYNSRGNTYNLPQSKTVLSRVDVETNMPENGATRMTNTFDYEDGYYDRYERDFFGFGKVVTRQHDTQNDDKVYRTVTQTYNNKTFVTKNLLQSQVLIDADSVAISTTANFYNLVAQPHDAKSVFPALKQALSETREPGSSEVLRSSETYGYDSFGNVTTYTSNVGGTQISSRIGYHHLADKHILNIPQSIAVISGDSEVRKRETVVDNLGNITQIRQFNTNETATYDMEYDTYGNLTRITRPANYKGERMWYAYTYDEVLHMLVTSVSDAFGYSSSTTYDYKWAAPIETLDLNGNRMVYTYDNHGRMASVTAPYELDAQHPYTIAFEYVNDAPVPYARTAHYDAHTGGNIETYTFVDALMRPVQVKKTSVVYQNGADERVMTVSGRVKYDAFGRATEAYLPVTEPLSNATTYSTVTDNVPPTLTTYDVQDRAIKITLPDGATSTTAYALVQHQGETMLQTTVTDALGREASSFTDGRGRTRTTLQHTNGQEVNVTYTYNPIGELLEVTHPNGYKTNYTYDKLGRKLSVNHPDAGLTTFEYDNANNLRRKQTPNLRKEIQEGGYITYEYNFERLREILYPKNIFNRVTYTYGEPGATYNRAGRLTLVEDGSGGEAYYYGKMGEVTKTVKTIMLSVTDIRTYVWAAEYDSWNRVQNMTYPDGEKVTYIYNPAGSLQSMISQKGDQNYLFIAHQGYDKFGQMVYRKAGNGTETTYAYDPVRQRLHNMTLMAKGSELMNNTYSYDAVDNILGITNTASPTGDIGSAYAHTYRYDDLNRLVEASGNSKGADYTLNMNYDAMGNILKKEQAVKGSTVASSHTFTYLYNATKPNAATMIGSHKYRYDENGNPVMREDTASGAYRQMVWDEENRLAMLNDDGYTSRYTYNHGGERVIKSHGGTTGVYVDGNPQGMLFHDADNYTAYVSPYLVVSNDRFTKHYYTGTQRVASKIGVGKFNNLYIEGGTNITAGQKDYAARMALIEKYRGAHYATLGIPPGPPTSKGIYGEPEYNGKALPNGVLGNYDIPARWPQPPVKNKPGQVPGPPVMYGPSVKPDDVQPPYGYDLPVPTSETDIYFYHSDHLGSTSYITDADANPTQFVCYMPFGQAFVDEHTTRPEMPYKFNGKEQDAETGLYYYGARYYDAMIAVWYGVDPMTEKYPNFSPFSYTFNNPVRFVDPTGMEPTDEEAAEMSDHIYKGKEGDRLTGGWILYKVDEGDKDNPGYRSGIYKREKKDGSYEYVMANAGTDDFYDAKEDLVQPFGNSGHMWKSIENAQKLDEILGKDVELTFVGHSKGGAEAAGNALATNRNAKIFNPAAINAKAYGLDSKNYTGNMTAFIVKGDILHSKLNWWSAIPIDKVVFLPRQHGSLFDKEPLRTYNQIRNHMMSSVFNALKEYKKK